MRSRDRNVRRVPTVVPVMSRGLSEAGRVAALASGPGPGHLPGFRPVASGA